MWREQNLAALASSLEVDIALTPVPELPLRKLPVPSVIVVHDVGPLVAPAFYSLSKKLRYQTVIPRTCRHATAVVCVSQATLLGLHAATALDPARCEVIGEGPQQLGAVRNDPNTDDPYLLYVGSLDPRKNVQTLLDAVGGSDPPLPARLVIVGPVEGRASAALERRLRDGDRIRHLGFVSPERLAELYRGALAVILPSLYEGFGLPVLEAMKMGAPVVVSDIPTAREVAGDAALYVTRAFDAACWRDALEQISSDAELRADLSRRGLAAAEAFTWSSVGASFSELLHRVARNGTPASVPPVAVESRA
jgi:glycosyltransferase involved in cell wall biosynthesis